MASKCLMLETREKKKFFTLLGNFKHLKEYCRAFGAKMFVVKADIERKKILDLKRLVPALRLFFLRSDIFDLSKLECLCSSNITTSST